MALGVTVCLGLQAVDMSLDSLRVRHQNSIKKPALVALVQYWKIPAVLSRFDYAYSVMRTNIKRKQNLNTRRKIIFSLFAKRFCIV
jgi:predicted glycosyltransferase